MTDLILSEQPVNESGMVLVVVGRLDAVSAGALKERLKKLIHEGYPRLIVDMQAVPFIDSSGLAALVSGLKAAREKSSTLVLANVGEQARTVFKVTLLDRVFAFYEDTASATKALSES